ncbi:MAG: flagellar biosynthesis protein FlhA [Bdellovibrionaceae bacterium]|jgi:flagellar biosynthesis protein FlhA|nr:flagellar biosynthesis protein FlhA [Pseudobdellovibrionaceae bacterium]
MDGIFEFLKRHDKYAKNVDMLVALALIFTLALMILPLPTIVMDFALAMSISSALLILLVAIYTEKSLDFSVFPSLLLMTTLFRLSLNVASTRLILSEGHNGEGSVGQVISAFGHFIVGNNYVIGLIVFIILVIINFVVITKGSGRVAEVAARFTLDAMPGKQMSIDADLNSGIITEKEARTRRKEIEEEADFYGSMDGASKFVRGDAIAGIIITVVNIVGGLLVGVLQKDLDIATAAQNYTMLTIGDGLVSQIPALIISTAAGIVVTRSSNKNMSKALVGQLLIKPKALYVLSAIMFLFGMVPGLPFMVFGLIGSVVATLAWFVTKNEEDKVTKKRQNEEEELRKPQKESIENMLPLDVVELEVGYGLINIVESNEPGDLLERIVSIRKQFAMDLGIIVPSIHLRDNLQLEPGEYRIMVKGNKVAGGFLRTDCMLAMDPGNVIQNIDGIPTTEPAFGLDALWIGASSREDAELAGYTVVDLPTVMATHLTEVVRTHAHELVGRQEADTLIENFKKQYPKVVDEVIPDKVPFGVVVKVLQNLLKEQVSIRDLLTIFESLADESYKSKDPEILTEAARKSLARGITSKYMSDEGQVNVLNLSANVEEAVSNGLLQTEQGVQLVMDPQVAQQIITDISDKIQSNPAIAAQPLLLTSPTSRRHLFKLINRFIPQLVILSHSELSAEAQVNSVGIVEVANAS